MTPTRREFLLGVAGVGVLGGRSAASPQGGEAWAATLRITGAALFAARQLQDGFALAKEAHAAIEKFDLSPTGPWRKGELWVARWAQAGGSYILRPVSGQDAYQGILVVYPATVLSPWVPPPAPRPLREEWDEVLWPELQNECRVVWGFEV